MSTHPHQSPKLHNAMWPGLVGKTPGTDEPPISLDRMLELTSKASVDGQKFEGVDLFLFDPHIPIDISARPTFGSASRTRSPGYGLEGRFARRAGLARHVGSTAQGGPEDREKFVLAVKKACRIAGILNDHGVRKYGVIRIDSADNPEHWYGDPLGNTKKIAETFRAAAKVAQDAGERLAAEGEICWAGMHSWKNMVALLEEVGLPGVWWAFRRTLRIPISLSPRRTMLRSTCCLNRAIPKPNSKPPISR